jgi:hypothetical protein
VTKAGRTVGILLAVACTGCGRPEVVVEERTDETELVVEAVLRYEMGQFLGDVEPPVLACLEVSTEDGSDDPSAALLGRIQYSGKAVGRSECRVEPDGVVHEASGQPAVLIGAGPILWKDAGEVRVAGRYYRSSVSSALPTYRAVRETEGWVCLGPVIEGLPVQ